MLFGFGKKSREPSPADQEEERSLVSFQGALNGQELDLKAHAKLAQVALTPTKELITDAIEKRADTVKIELKGERGQVVFTVDGVPQTGVRYAKPQAQAMLQMLKLLAGLDIRLKSKSLRGGMKADFDGHPYEMMVESNILQDGTERLTVRIRDLKAKLNTIEDLGFPDTVKKTLRSLCTQQRGIVLVVGPPGSGVTTTLYAFLRGLDLFMYSVFTTVNMGSREVYNVTKFEAREGDTPVATIERMIRAEANVVFLEPIVNAEWARHAAAVADRICVLSEMPAKDAAHGIVQLRDWIGDAAKTAELLEGVFSPKLVRTLCPDCREAFRPNPKSLSKVGLPPETKVLYRKFEPQPDPKTGELPEPCRKCHGSGYYGRAAILEMILASNSIRQLIAKGASADQLREQARQEGMLTFTKDGLRLVAEGKTSLEELQRVFKATN